MFIPLKYLLILLLLVGTSIIYVVVVNPDDSFKVPTTCDEYFAISDSIFEKHQKELKAIATKCSRSNSIIGGDTKIKLD